jgi:Na+/H+-dicarboxylate symporter
MTLFAVDGHLLVQVVWVSLLAGVGMSAVFSFVIVGAARAGDARRAGRTGAATAYGILAVLAFAAFAGGVVLGVQSMFN